MSARRKRPRLSGHARLKGAFGLVAVISLLVGTWSGLRVLAIHVGFAASGWGGNLLVFMATLAVFGVVANILGIFIRNRHPDYYSSLSDAIRRLATGDFDVSVSIPDRGGGPDLVLGKMAGEINNLAQSLKKMEDMRQEFISTASHEIQSPLTSIAGFAKALREEGLPNETKLRFLGIIEDEAGRLSKLSEGLLRLTAFESRELELSSVDLGEQIRKVVIAAEPQWMGKDLQLSLDLDSLEVQADEGLLSQVWTNLFHNATKFSNRGGALSISLRRSGDFAEARFSDAGLGISPEDLPFVFDRFFKADRARARADSASGNGLGLAIVKKAIELHGGSVTAESLGLGKGSSFIVRLPLSGSRART